MSKSNSKIIVNNQNYVKWSWILGYQNINLDIFDEIKDLTNIKKDIHFIKYNKNINSNFLSYKFMYTFKPDFNDKY